MKHDLPPNYKDIITSLKDKIRKARLNASFKLNADLLYMYKEIGSTIAIQEKKAGWGAKIIEKLSEDLRSEFEDMKGLSPRNLRYMRDFALAYPSFPFLQEALAESAEKGGLANNESILQGELAKLTWYHHITLLDKVKEPKNRAFYITQTIQNGWTRDVMVHQIEAGLHEKHKFLTDNPETATNNPELVAQIFKDPYKFEFIYLGTEAREKDLEDALASQMTKVLKEFGPYFGFLGRQYRVVLGEKEFFYDMLFYHTRLKRYIVIELKIGDFKAEYVGKMNLYLNIADEQLRDHRDEESIGLILCKTKDGLVAEYALRDSNKSIGIVEYKLKERLPEFIQGELPSIEEIEQNMKQLKRPESPLKARMEGILQKLASIQLEEVKTVSSYQNSVLLFDRSVKPLFDYLLKELRQLSQYFLVTSYFWHLDKKLDDIESFETSWKDEKRFTVHQEPYFQFRLSGFRKAGVNAFNTSIQLNICLDEYQYGFKLINYNDQRPFMRKLYDEALSQGEIEKISEICCSQIMDHIAWQVEQIGQIDSNINI